MAWGIERTFDVYLEDISIYKYIYTYMEYIFTCVCMWCFSAGRLSDEYERLYVYIYIYYHHILDLYSYIRESFPLSFSLATLSAYIKCVWPSILEQLANVRHISPSAELHIYTYICLVMLRRISRYIHPCVYDAFYDPRSDSRSAVHRSCSLRYCDFDTATDCPISAADT